MGLMFTMVLTGLITPEVTMLTMLFQPAYNANLQRETSQKTTF